MTPGSLIDRIFLRLFSWRGKILDTEKISRRLRIVYREQDDGGCTLKAVSVGNVRYLPLDAVETRRLRDALTRVIEESGPPGRS